MAARKKPGPMVILGVISLLICSAELYAIHRLQDPKPATHVVRIDSIKVARPVAK